MTIWIFGVMGGVVGIATTAWDHNYIALAWAISSTIWALNCALRDL